MFTVVKFCRHRAAARRGRVKVREGIKPPLLTSAPDFRRAENVKLALIKKKKKVCLYLRVFMSVTEKTATFLKSIQEINANFCDASFN